MKTKSLFILACFATAIFTSSSQAGETTLSSNYYITGSLRAGQDSNNNSSDGSPNSTFAIGRGAKSYFWGCVAVGLFNDSLTTHTLNPPVFIVGKGTDITARSNAFVVKRNGDVGVGADSPTAKLHVVGDIYSTASLKAETSVTIGTTGTPVVLKKGTAAGGTEALNVVARVRVLPGGDLSMGSFTAGTAPQ